MSLDSVKPAKGQENTQTQAAAEKASHHLHKEASAFTDRDIVRKDARTAKYCPDTKDGDICYMTQIEAEKLAKELGKVMPSTRWLADHQNPKGILELDYLKNVFHGKVPKGYYEVAGVDEHGNVDDFYFKNKKPGFLSGLLQHRQEIDKLDFWTSTLVVGKPGYAHVYYGYLGGGGVNFMHDGKVSGTPDDHKRDLAKHAVILIDPKDLDK